ncbi:hypothetical protein ACJX0J_028793, partial [Zea mays]
VLLIAVNTAVITMFLFADLIVLIQECKIVQSDHGELGLICGLFFVSFAWRMGISES